ncbi:MAG: hypothetical protein H6721_00975 [Sandaracinus sp.]|nr:hypothetical protein [Sandaracinus sp.]
MASCFVALSVTLVGACDDEEDPSTFDPRYAEFERAPEAEWPELIREMVSAMATAPGECWDASAIVTGDPSVGLVSQWQFTPEADGVRYRYVGFDTSFGWVRLYDLGHYGGRPTAVVETWTGGPEAFLLDGDELVHVSVAPGGGTSSVRFGRNRGTCL